ncbi:MAG: transcriptional regulator [Dehalococcoidales bacterium]|nr:transcriptional regulator [Dehalococcoidales bacterium]
MLESELLIHQPSRLHIMAALVALPVGESMDFVSLKDLANLTDGNLSSHLSTLEHTGYVSIDKSFEGKKPKTRIWVTSKGREAFSRYVEELERILKGTMIKPQSSS